MKLLIFAALFSVAMGQQLLSLSSFKGGNVVNNFINTAPYGLFVSAHSDNQAALNSIFVVLKDGTQTSLSTLRKQTFGKLDPYVVTESAYLITSLTTNQLAALKGVIYLTTTAQLNNKNFAVYEISSASTFNLQTVAEDTTTVFLNTHMGTNPYKSTVISQWKQDSRSFSYLYAGIPQDTPEPINHHIFSNPVHTESLDATQSVFIPNVEKFSLATTEAFYLKTSRGGPSFRIEPSYYNIDGSTTTATTTTGFYMKPLGGDETSATVHVRRDTKYSGVCGASTVGKLQTGGKVSVSINGGLYDFDESAAPNDFASPWTVKFIGENFKISSTNGKSGVYYVQYFVQQGPLNSGTPAPGAPTVPGRVETTTKSSGNTVNPPVPVPTVPGRVHTTTKSSSTHQLFITLIVFISSFGFL